MVVGNTRVALGLELVERRRVGQQLLVAVGGWHIARALAPVEMKEALLREGLHPAAGSTFGRVHGDEEAALVGGHEVSESGADYAGGSDPSSVDEIGRPGVPRNHGEGTLNR